MNEPDHIVMRTGWGSYVVLLLGMSPFVLLSIGLAVRNQSQWQCIGIGALVLAIALTWLLAFRIELTPEQLTYRSLVGGKASIKRKDILSACIEAGRGEYADRAKPMLRLVIETRDRMTPLVVNLKPFSRADIQCLCKALNMNEGSIRLANL